MKKRNNIYIILSYLFFIYPPFIWGLVLIYQERNTGNEHIPSLFINLILIAVITAICTLLAYYKKLHIPSEFEIKQLIFGLIGNVVVYFYTFQNLMKIDDYVTIYLILLIVLGVHTLLISKKIQAKELWILMSIFLVLDIAHMIGTGCGFTDGWSCYESANVTLMYVIYTMIIITCLSLYSYKLYKLNQWDVLKLVNITLILTLSILFQHEPWLEEKFSLTVMIALPFFTILDFIVNVVNKKYSHKMLFHYLRAYSILIIFAIMGAFEFFKGEASYEILSIMVTIAYVSLFMTIFRHLLKVNVASKRKVSKDIIFGIVNEALLEKIKEQFGEEKAKLVSLSSEDYSLIAMKEDIVVGFICTKRTDVLDNHSEAVIEIIEVHNDYQRLGIASKLIEQTEKHYKANGIKQIRAWTFIGNTNYIALWQKLDYLITKTVLYYKPKKQYIEGYYFIKKL